jgi:arylsulfatase A-like enzyme
MLLQDAWLKEMLDVVRSFGRLDRTVVAVTGDHGVRTRAEDPSLPVGEISDYMFRVPLFVYAPQTLSSTVRIDDPTSHIDVAPTLLALFGRSRDLGQMQGIPIWQRSVTHRIYLLAFVYGGADGFVENRRYYMRQGLSGATFASNRFLFEDHDQVPSGDPVAGFVNDELRKLDALQQALVSRTVETIRN